MPDLHGSVGAMLTSDRSSVSHAFRYDAYGELLSGNVYTATDNTLPTPWRYQGNLLLSSSTDADLYDGGALGHSPCL